MLLSSSGTSQQAGSPVVFAGDHGVLNSLTVGASMIPGGGRPYCSQGGMGLPHPLSTPACRRGMVLIESHPTTALLSLLPLRINCSFIAAWSDLSASGGLMTSTAPVPGGGLNGVGAAALTPNSTSCMQNVCSGCTPVVWRHSCSSAMLSEWLAHRTSCVPASHWLACLVQPCCFASFLTAPHTGL